MLNPETFLIDDPRVSKITDKIVIGVKEGVASSSIMTYKYNSNSSSSTMWNINIPSENTLIDRNLIVRSQITVNAKFSHINLTDTVVSAVPTAFPLNQILQSATLKINNSKVSVQSADILNVLTKQYSQQYLSKNMQGTPNYVDKYYALASDAFNNKDKASSYWSNASNAEKDSDTIGRGDATGCTITLYTAAGAKVADVLHDSHTIPAATVSGDYIIQFVYNTDESIKGLPTSVCNQNESSYVGVKGIELILQYGELKNVANIHITGRPNNNGVALAPAVIADPVQLAAAVAAGATTDLPLSFSPGMAVGAVKSSTVLADSSTLVFKYILLHASQYAKLSKRNIINFDEFVSHPTTHIRTTEEFQTISNELSLTQIPDKLYITIRPQPVAQHSKYSNNLAFPIESLNIKFNNVAGLLSDMSMQDLYTMSRRNGCQQTWSEFSGQIYITNADGDQELAPSLGSIVVIDPVRDLGLNDMLSASSLGSFSCQIKANAKGMLNVPFSKMVQVELAVMLNYAGTMIIEAGSSQLITGMLTKEAVLDTKAKGSSNIDYEDIEKLAGGNVMKQGKSVIGKIIKSERGRVARGLDANVDGVVDKGAEYGASRVKDTAHN